MQVDWGPGRKFWKKKPDLKYVSKVEEEIPLPSKSEIIRKDDQSSERKVIISEPSGSKHEPVIERPSKAFSIKDLISEEDKQDYKPSEYRDVPAAEKAQNPKSEFSPEAFETAWVEFTEQLKGEGTRIVSMFKTIKPEFENEQTIKIHLSNAAQKDTFILNYKQRLITFLESRFIMPSLEVETTIDLTEANDILYTDEQKAGYLFNKYPVLKDMKKTFNLDIT